MDQLDYSTEMISLLEEDRLSEFCFMLKEENSVIHQMVFSTISKLKNLKRLEIKQLSASAKSNIEILNSNLNRHCQIQDLTIQFSHDIDQK